MAYSSIAKPTDYFNTKLYTGDGNNSKAITGVGFQPDWIWIKKRSGTASHMISDSVRGVTKTIYTESTSAELTSDQYGWVSAFGTDGFTISNTNVAAINENGATHVSWNWKAGTGAGSSNSDGSITTTVSANQTAGFSIVSYTGNATAGATIGHGLGVAPKMVIVKNRSNAQNWFIYHEGIGATKVIYLDLTNAQQTLTQGWNDTAPTSSVVSLGTEAGTNQSGANMIAYCFAEKQGYSKISSFVGNGSSNGTYVHLGFRPSFILYKVSSASSDWYLQDNKRLTFNVNNTRLEANNSDAEVTGAADSIDMLSNGFKMRHTSSSFNNNGATYIYYAVAENPFVGNDSGTAVPVTAG